MLCFRWNPTREDCTYIWSTTLDVGHLLLRCHPNKGSFIYDVHTQGRGVRLRWTHMDVGGGQAICGRPCRKLKLGSIDVILSSSHAKKLVYFLTRISSLDGIKSGHFSAV